MDKMDVGRRRENIYGRRDASLPVVAEWVKSSLGEIGNDMIERSFKKCGIFNAMDGTEDDL